MRVTDVKASLAVAVKDSPFVSFGSFLVHYMLAQAYLAMVTWPVDKFQDSSLLFLSVQH